MMEDVEVYLVWSILAGERVLEEATSVKNIAVIACQNVNPSLVSYFETWKGGVPRARFIRLADGNFEMKVL